MKAEDNNSKVKETVDKTEEDKEDVAASKKESSEKSQKTVVPTKIKKRKKKQPKDGPKHPLTGYIRFMNVRREELRIENPTATAIEMTKQIGEEWNKLSDECKKPYLEAAELDKERFHKECIEYNKKKKEMDESSCEPTENTTNKTNGISVDTLKIDKEETKPHEPPKKIQKTGDYDIPIFTEEFLDHNKTIDSELRLLRKSNTDYEQQNSVLEKHVENMTNGINKLQEETKALKENNTILQSYITKLKTKLATALAGLALPTEPNGANIENISKYMTDLHEMATSNSHGPASLNKAKDIIRKLDLQIQL